MSKFVSEKLGGAILKGGNQPTPRANVVTRVAGNCVAKSGGHHDTVLLARGPRRTPDQDPAGDVQSPTDAGRGIER